MAASDWNGLLQHPQGPIDAMGAFQAGQGAQLSANTQQLANNQAAYQQALQQTVENLVSKSIDDSGNFRPETYMMLARQTPFGASAMTAGLAQVVAQRKAAAESAQAGNTMLASGVNQSQVFPKSGVWLNGAPTTVGPGSAQGSQGAAPDGSAQPLTQDASQGFQGARRPLPGMAGYSNTDPRAPVRRPMVQSSSLAPAVPASPDDSMGPGYSVGKVAGSLNGGAQLSDETMVPTGAGLEGDPNSGSAANARALAMADAPNTLLAIQTEQTSRPDPAAGITPISPQAVANASAAQKAEWVRGLRAQGIPMPADQDLTADDIAAGLTTAAQNKVRAAVAGMNPDKPGESLASAATAANQAGSIANATTQAIGDEGRSIKGERLSQASTAQSTAFAGQTRESIENARQTYANKLGLDPDMLGPAGSPQAAETGREIQTRGGQYQALLSQVQEILPKLPELNKPANKKLLDQEVASLTRLVNQVAGGTSAAHSMDQSLQEIGGPTNLFEANGIGQGARILLTNGTPQQQARLIGALPGIIFRNTLGTDYKGLGGDPNAWKSQLDSQVLGNNAPGAPVRNSPPAAGGAGAPKVGSTNAQGQVWTGKRWL